MISYIVLVIFMAVVMLVELKRQKSLLSAPVIYPVMWMLALVTLVIQGDRYWPIGTGTLCVIGAGYVLFCVGYEAAVFALKKNSGSGTEMRIGISDLGAYIIASISLLIGIGYFFVLRPYLDSSNILMSWVGIRDSVLYGWIKMPYFLTVSRYFNRVAVWFLMLSIVYAKESIKRKKYLLCLFIVAISSLMVSFADFSRNGLLFDLLPLVFIILMKKPLDNRRIVILLGIEFVLFLAFFIWFVKYRESSYISTDITDEMRLSMLADYLCSPIACLNYSIHNGMLEFITTSGGGRYTMSGVWGLISRFIGGEGAPPVVQGYVQVGPEVSYNVYTVYQWTGMDFGLLYALLWHFLFGIIYGALFTFSLRGNEYAILTYSVLSYPLVMMFFEDQYFSIGQTWIILMGFGVIIWLITRIGLKRNENISGNGNL